jgi:hypothetical protein
VLALTVVTALAMTQAGPADTATYRDAATAALVTKAAVRHAHQVSQLERYVARVRSRMEASVSVTRFGPGLRVLDMDLVAGVHWQRPNDVSVELLGARTKVARLPGANRDMLGGWFVGLVTSEPWFAPGAMGDEIDFMGIPDEPALHPLAPGADRRYRYAIVDSVRMSLVGRTLRSIAVSVEPREYDRSLVQGTMWLDADSLDLVRLSVAFVGPGLWEEDDDESPQLVGAEADLEYALHEGRFWLPYRQVLTLDWRYRYLPGAVLPARAVSTFDAYQLAQVPPIVFERRTSGSRLERDCEPWSQADASECGARREVRRAWDDDRRYQVVIPPLDSLARYDFGDTGGVAATFDDEVVGRRLTELAKASGALPPEARAAHRTLVHPVIVAALRDGVRFNRVHGPSLGGTARFQLGSLVTLEPTARVSAGDERLTGALVLRRDAPRSDAWITARHQLREAEPWTSGQSLAGTLRAAFLGDDAADYYLVTGGEVGVMWRLGPARGTRLEIGWERQRSVTATDGSVLHDVFFGDGRFPPNPAIVDGDFARLTVSRRFGAAGGPTLEVGAEGLGGGDAVGGRVWLAGDAPFAIGQRRARVVTRAGYAGGDSLPQLEFRAGGRYTVRGYEYGVRRGPGVWAVQGEIEIVPNEWVAPLVLADVGNVIGSDSSDPLVGVGLGLSVGNGWLRIDLVKGVNPATAVRADLGVRLPVW